MRHLLEAVIEELAELLTSFGREARQQFSRLPIEKVCVADELLRRRSKIGGVHIKPNVAAVRLRTVAANFLLRQCAPNEVLVPDPLAESRTFCTKLEHLRCRR